MLETALFHGLHIRMGLSKSKLKAAPQAAGLRPGGADADANQRRETEEKRSATRTLSKKVTMVELSDIHAGTGGVYSDTLGGEAKSTAPAAAHAARPRVQSDGTALLLEHGMSKEEIDRNKAQTRLCDLVFRGNTEGIKELLETHKDLVEINTGDYDRRALPSNQFRTPGSRGRPMCLRRTHPPEPCPSHGDLCPLAVQVRRCTWRRPKDI